MIKKLLFTLFIAFTASSLFSQGVIISEIADGTAPYGYPKYVELTNLSSTSFDLDGYKIRRSGNGGGFSDTYVFNSTHVLQAGESIVVTNVDTSTTWANYNLPIPAIAVYGVSSGSLGNGDDAFAFTDASDVVIDIYGEELIDGTGTVWEYTDSYVYRNNTVLSSNTTFTTSEWYIAPVDTLDAYTSDMSAFLTPGTHNATPPSVTDAYILDFTFVEQTGPATIDTLSGTVTIEVLFGSTITALVPTITVSTGATINPNSGVVQDYSSPVAYVVTAANGTTTKNWTVTVTEAPASNKAYIETFVLPEQTGAAVIDTAAKTVSIEVLNGSTMNSLTPTITVSAGATINPLSGTAQDFTSVFTYTVTAQSGSNVAWNVTVTEAAGIPLVSIYDIQGQAANSPYDTMIVQTGGIVTATSNSGYWIQNNNTSSAWSGLYIYDTDTSHIKPLIGDSVTVAGLITEYNGLTEMKNIVSIDISPVMPLIVPAPTVINTADASEQYESVFVKVEDADCINTDAGYGMWTVNNGSNAADSLLIDDVMYHYIPVLGTNYDVQGVLYYSYNEFKILPRDTNDIVLIVSVEMNKDAKFTVYPNPAIEEINLDNVNNVDYITISDINGNFVNTIDVSSENVKINTSCLQAGMYVISVYDKKGTLSTVKFIKK